jgi:peptidoglycan hydrolase-like protein with peptidoglycan-binding domain
MLFRLLSHRKEIEDAWNKIAPIIKDVLPLVEKVAPGALASIAAPGSVPPPAPLNPTGTGQPAFSVTWLQETLNKVDNAGLTVDGSYGEGTKKAVTAFQTKHGLVADGWAGVTTSAELYAALQKMA